MERFYFESTHCGYYKLRFSNYVLKTTTLPGQAASWPASGNPKGLSIVPLVATLRTAL